MKHKTAFAAASIAVLTALTVSACGGNDATKNTSAHASTSSSTGARPVASTSVVPAARTVFTTWSDRNLDYGTWWSRLKPLLSPAGQQAYAGTDPANIPAVKVTGPYRLDPTAPDDPDTTALVHVNTDRGRFGLFMVRTGPGKPWLLLQIMFPHGIH